MGAEQPVVSVHYLHVGGTVRSIQCCADGTQHQVSAGVACGLKAVEAGAFAGVLAAAVQTVADIDPDEPKNMPDFDAVEWTQEAPHSSRLNDVASMNMKSMLAALDTSHFEMSPLNEAAPLNM